MLIQSCSKIFINIPWDIKKYYFINELHVKTGNWNRKFFKYLVDIITHKSSCQGQKISLEKNRSCTHTDRTGGLYPSKTIPRFGFGGE